MPAPRRKVALLVSALVASVVFLPPVTQATELRCGGEPVTIVGTAGADILRGTPGADAIEGRGGNDLIIGRDGNDRLCGGGGRDTLRGNDGNDRLFGDPGGDDLFGGDGDDRLDGDFGTDSASGGPGEDNCVNVEDLTGCERAGRPPITAFVFPDPGTIVDGPTVLAATETNGAPFGALEEATFEYSQDGVTWTLIDRLPVNELDVETIWNTSEVAGGLYQVRATIENVVGIRSTDQMMLEVNGQPDAHAQFQCMSPTTIQFMGGGSTDPDGDQIVRYTWDFGDGTAPQTGAHVQHTYAAPGTYFPQLTVEDVHGAQGMDHFGVDTVLCATVFKGCDPVKMDVVGKDDAGWDMHWMPDGSKRKLGRFTSIDPNTWKDAPDDMKFTIYVNFEVITDLQPNSEPSQCVEGQIIQMTTKRADGKNPFHWSGDKAGPEPHDDPPGPEVDCGFENKKEIFCDDDYRNKHADPIPTLADAKKDMTKVHIDQSQIRWLDGPGTSGMEKGSLLRGGFRLDGRFKASVKGDTKTVRCSWKVEIIVTATKDAPKVEGRGVYAKDCP